MIEAEILVVGAGPAGSVLARRLADAGREALLLDRAAFPRPKVCGGGLPLRTWAELDPPDACGLRATVDRVVLTASLGARLTVDEGIDARVVDRTAFDHALVRAAQAAGATLRERARVVGVARADARWRVRLQDGTTLAAPALAACDGADSAVLRSLGEPPPPRGIAVEAYAPLPPDTPAATRRTAWFDFRTLADGYAWAFPRGDEWGLGAGTSRWPAPDLRQRFFAFAAAFPHADAGAVRHIRGAPLPHFRAPRPWYAREGLFLCGDAAGLVDPLTGEGIHYAVRSAALAAEAIARRDEAWYNAVIGEELASDLAIAARFARHAARTPRWAKGLILRTRRGRRVAERFSALLTGRISYRELYASLHGGAAP